jgi:hypothetical protein
MMMQKTIICHCDHSFDIDIAEPLDISPATRFREEILAGTFLTVRCPQCGDTLKPEFELTFTASDAQRPIHLVPEKERDHLLFGTHPVPPESSVVVGFAELRDRVRVMDANLDFRAVEYLKYQILVRAGGAEGVRIYFDRLRDDKLRFAVHGLRSDEVALVDLPGASYRRAERDVAAVKPNEVIRTLLEEPYVSVHKIEIEGTDDA